MKKLSAISTSSTKSLLSSKWLWIVSITSLTDSILLAQILITCDISINSLTFASYFWSMPCLATSILFKTNITFLTL